MFAYITWQRNGKEILIVFSVMSSLETSKSYLPCFLHVNCVHPVIAHWHPRCGVGWKGNLPTHVGRVRKISIHDQNYNFWGVSGEFLFGLVIVWGVNYCIILFFAPKSCFYSLLYSTLISTLCYPPGSFWSHDGKCPERSQKGLRHLLPN